MVHVAAGIGIVLASLLVGMWGYGHFEDLCWEDAFLNAADGRKKSPAYEVRWLNLCGFCLRPGFGYPLWVAYVVWVGVVASMYPLCRWFARTKRQRRAWWLSYL